MLENIEKNFRMSVIVVCWIILFIFLVMLIRYFADLFAIVAISLSITYIMLWPIKAIEDNLVEIKPEHRRLVSTIITYILAIIFISLITLIVIQPVSRQLIDLSVAMPKNIVKIQNKAINYINKTSVQYGINVSDYLDTPTEEDFEQDENNNIIINKDTGENKEKTAQIIKLKVYKELENLAKHGVSVVPLLVSGTLRNIIYAIIILMLSFYFILSEQSLRNWLKYLIEGTKLKKLVHIEEKIHHSIIGYIKGQAIIGLITAICMWIVYYSFSLKYSLTLALLMGIGQFVPFLGHAIALLAAIIVGLVQSPVSVIFIIIVFLAVQIFCNNIIAPKLLGNLTGLNPVIIIISIIIGERIAGLIGVFLAVPVACIINIIILGLCPPLMEDHHPQECKENNTQTE